MEIEEAVKTISTLGIEEAVRVNARQHIQKAYGIESLGMMIV